MADTGFKLRFGQRVRKARKKCAMSQEALAAAAGLHQHHVSLIERGLRAVQLDTLEALARALRVQPAQLMPTIDMPSTAIARPARGRGRVDRR